MAHNNPLADIRTNPQGCLSDHSFQGAEIRCLNSDNTVAFTLHGKTWNLMNRCRSKEDNGGKFKNNPWNFTEDDAAYQARKTRQLDRIIELCQQEPCDFFCLQEIDCFYDPATRNAFKQRLDAMGWGFVITAKQHQAKANLVLYRKAALTYTGNARGILPSGHGSHSGFAVDFQLTGTKTPCTIASLHLDYDEDYSQSIPEFQRQQTQAGVFTIMAGDANHQPNTAIKGLCNDWNHCTNLGGDDDGNLHHVDVDPKKKQRTKCYDGFFANPTKKTAVQIIERQSEVFVPGPAPGSYQLQGVNTGRSHLSALGAPWVRGGLRENNNQTNASAIRQQQAAVPLVNPGEVGAPAPAAVVPQQQAAVPPVNLGAGGVPAAVVPPANLGAAANAQIPALQSNGLQARIQAWVDQHFNSYGFHSRRNEIKGLLLQKAQTKISDYGKTPIEYLCQKITLDRDEFSPTQAGKLAAEGFTFPITLSLNDIFNIQQHRSSKGLTTTSISFLSGSQGYLTAREKLYLLLDQTISRLEKLDPQSTKLTDLRQCLQQVHNADQNSTVSQLTGLFITPQKRVLDVLKEHRSAKSLGSPTSFRDFKKIFSKEDVEAANKANSPER